MTTYPKNARDFGQSSVLSLTFHSTLNCHHAFYRNKYRHYLVLKRGNRVAVDKFQAARINVRKLPKKILMPKILMAKLRCAQACV